MDILVNVANQKLKIATNLKSLVAGTQEFVRFTFNLTGDWDDLMTFAQFQQNGVAYNAYLDENNSTYLPSEIGVGTCTLMLYGSNDKTIATTNYLTLSIDKNILVSDATSTEISQSLYNQLVTKVNSLSKEVESVSSSGISAANATEGQVPTADGKGGWSWENQNGGTGGGSAGGDIIVDTTLTQAGQAADAAEVGNRLSALSEEIAAIPSGADGKSAYQYAVDGGYTGTETEFAAKLAQEKFANPNALTLTGAVSATYDGSAPVSVEIPSGGGGGSSVGSGKAKSQILIDQEITELTASLSVTLEHDFHNLIAIINCGSAGAALTAGSDGTAVASKIGLMIDTTDFGWNSRKVAFMDTSTGTWKSIMFGAEWADDLSVFKRGFAAEITTGTKSQYYSSFGGTSALYGTLGTDDNAPRTGKTANIVVNGAYLNVGTRVILWGEYYE